MVDGLEYWFAAALIIVLLALVLQQIEIGRLRAELETTKDASKAAVTKVDSLARRIREMKTPRKR